MTNQQEAWDAVAHLASSASTGHSLGLAGTIHAENLHGQTAFGAVTESYARKPISEMQERQ